MRRANVGYASIVVLAAFALAACSSSSKGSATTTSTTAGSTITTSGQTPTAGHGTPTTSASADATFSARLLRAGELLDYAPGGPTDVRRSVDQYLKGLGMPSNQLAAETAKLQRSGFVAGTTQNFASPTNPNVGGISIVVQFRTHAGALSYVAAESVAAPQTTLTPFVVSGIPGARGFDLSGGRGAGHNIAFADGTFYYLVGVGAPTLSALPTRAKLIQAATVLYRRVHSLRNS